MNDKTLAATFLIWVRPNNKCDQLDGTVYFHSFFFSLALTNGCPENASPDSSEGHPTHCLSQSIHGVQADTYNGRRSSTVMWQAILKRSYVHSTCMNGFSVAMRRTSIKKCVSLCIHVICVLIQIHGAFTPYFFRVIMTPAWWFKKRIALSLFQNEAQWGDRCMQEVKWSGCNQPLKWTLYTVSIYLIFSTKMEKKIIVGNINIVDLLPSTIWYCVCDRETDHLHLPASPITKLFFLFFF